MMGMSQYRLAALVVFTTGAIWGLYWLPVRALSGAGLGGPAGVAAITAAAALALAPVAWRLRAAIARAGWLTTGSLLLGGASFTLYTMALDYGRVAIVVLLFFLTPVWSTVIARLLGQRATWPRIAAIACGLLGLGIMLSADGSLPLPRNLGEWMALASGIGWALATTGLSLRAPLAAPGAAFIFAAGAFLTALALWPLLVHEGPVTVPGPAAFGIAAATGVFWWALSMTALMWATVRLEPARVGLLLMAEVVVGAGSAALLAGEPLSALEILGGAIVILSSLLELWPAKHSARPA